MTAKAILIASGIITAAIGLIASWRLVPLGVPGEWVWHYRMMPVSFGSLLLPLAYFVLLAIVVAHALRHQPHNRRQRLMFLLALSLLTIGLRFSTGAVESPERQPVGLFEAFFIVSRTATTYFTEAKDLEEESLLDYLRTYHHRLRKKPYHAATHPPGVIIFFAAVRRVVKEIPPLRELSMAMVGGEDKVKRNYTVARRQWLDVEVSADEFGAAWLSAQVLLLLGTLAVLPLLFSAGSWRGGIVSAALFAIAPGGLVFAYVSDQVLVLLSSLCVWLTMRWEAKEGKGWLDAAILGLVCALGLFFSFKFLPVYGCLGVWLGIVWVVRIAAGKEAISVIRDLVILGSVVFGAFALVYATFGFNIVATFYAATQSHAEQAVEGVRTYWKWLLLNPLDFGLLSLGPALTVVLAAALWRRISYQPSAISYQQDSPVAPLLALLVTLALLDVSGIVRGEVARLWLPFLPIACLAAGRSAETLKLNRPTPVLLLMSCQFLTALALKANVDFVRPW